MVLCLSTRRAAERHLISSRSTSRAFGAIATLHRFAKAAFRDFALYKSKGEIIMTMNGSSAAGFWDINVVSFSCLSLNDKEAGNA